MRPQEQERYAQQLHQIACYHARRLLQRQEDREDCAMDFVGRMLRLEALERGEAKFHSNAWLHRCARRHTLNWIRSLRRQEYRAQLFSQKEREILVDTAPPPDDLYLSVVFWRQFAQTLGQVAERPCRLFVGFYIQGYSTEELAQKFGMAPHAVEQSLLRTRRRLRGLLEQKGWNDSAVLEYIATLRAPIDLAFVWKKKPRQK